MVVEVAVEAVVEVVVIAVEAVVVNGSGDRGVAVVMIPVMAGG